MPCSLIFCTSALFRTIDAFPRPVVARVNGPALGGAMGLIACADIAVASDEAVFGFSETKLGIAPAVAEPVCPTPEARVTRPIFSAPSCYVKQTARYCGR